MSVFGNRNYGQQPVARTPNFTGAANNSANIQAINQQNKRRQKQENIQGAAGLANSLREGGMLGGAIPAFKKAYAGGPATNALAASVAPGATAGTLGGLGAAAIADAAIPGESN
jgi:hypothetical protein